MFVETCVTRAQLEPQRADIELGADELRDPLGGRERRVDLDVERDQRRARGDERGAGGGMAGRPEVGLEAVQPAGLAELRAGAAAGQLAVQIDGDAELPDLVGEHERLGARGALVGLVEVDDRRHVDGSHARVQALVARQVDARDRRSDAFEHGGVQLAGLARRA